MRSVLVWLSGIVLLCVSAMAMAQGSGSITIDGKTIALPHARAWVGGKQIGMPLAHVVLSEKPLKDLQWSAVHEALTAGELGIALLLKPSLSMESRPADATLKYLFDQQTNTELYAPNFMAPWTLEYEGVTATDFSVTKGVVHGKAEWKGSSESVFVGDDGAVKTSTITAWSADFTLPLEEPPPTP